MKKRTYIIIFFTIFFMSLFLVLIFKITNYSLDLVNSTRKSYPVMKSDKIHTIINGREFLLKTARTPEQMSKGLMFVQDLPENQGMLFIYNDEKPRTFWMKNTLISLDLIFLNKDYQIIDVKQNFLPCKNNPCLTYTSKPAKYVIEINSGIFSNYTFYDKVIFKDLILT